MKEGTSMDQTLQDYLSRVWKIDEGGDMVNCPSHYNQGNIECIDAIEAATINKSGIEAVCVANIIKYLWRYEVKGKPLQDVNKAKWYLEKLIERM